LPIATIREMGGADSLRTEGLVLQGMYVSYMRTGCKTELPVVSICSIWMEVGKVMTIVGPGLQKAI
jgi:hypothetical protein